VPDDVLRALIDPTAPLPAIWPSGVLGVFLLFCVPIGGGIPFGVIMARDAGISPAATAGLYFLSDLVLAVTTEPVLALLRWLSKRIEFLARIGHVFARFTGTAGLRDEGMRGPLGLVLVAFSVSPTTGRAAAAAAGHGFVSGWAIAITGDMLYFCLLMATTLWVSSIFGDDRLTIGAVLIGTWVLPLVIRRIRQRSARPAPATVQTTALTLPAAARPASPRPKRVTHTGRRRASRGLHR
jgi:hypothetical protein